MNWVMITDRLRKFCHYTETKAGLSQLSGSTISAIFIESLYTNYEVDGVFPNLYCRIALLLWEGLFFPASRSESSDIGWVFPQNGFFCPRKREDLHGGQSVSVCGLPLGVLSDCLGRKAVLKWQRVAGGCIYTSDIPFY
jgi:hypothetical protein